MKGTHPDEHRIVADAESAVCCCIGWARSVTIRRKFPPLEGERVDEQVDEQGSDVMIRANQEWWVR